MQKLRLALDVVRRMTLYGGGAGIVLGLLYVWISNVIGIIIGAVVGTITGLIEGLIMAALITFVIRPLAEVHRYRHIISGINSAIAAVVTSWVFYTILGRITIWNLITVSVFIVIPVIIVGAAGWRATIRSLKWVQDQSQTATILPPQASAMDD